MVKLDVFVQEHTYSWLNPTHRHLANLCEYGRESHCCGHF